jgi:hypothetical protein
MHFLPVQLAHIITSDPFLSGIQSSNAQNIQHSAFQTGKARCNYGKETGKRVRLA